MTSQEAIEYLKLFHGYDLPVQEALDMAIRSLEAWDEIIKNLERGNNSIFSMVLNDIKKHLKEVES